jgi:uncharacterized protein (DUF952 family)
MRRGFATQWVALVPIEPATHVPLGAGRLPAGQPRLPGIPMQPDPHPRAPALMPETIYKLCPAALWREAERLGRFDGAPVDRDFRGVDDLLVLSVDAEALGEALRFEPSRGGALFPHLYAPLPLAAVRAVRPVAMEGDGGHALAAILEREGAAS